MKDSENRSMVEVPRGVALPEVQRHISRRSKYGTLIKGSLTCRSHTLPIRSPARSFSFIFINAERVRNKIKSFAVLLRSSSNTTFQMKCIL